MQSMVTKAAVAAIPVDPYSQDVRCDHRVELPLFGHRLVVESNSIAVGDLVGEAFGPASAWHMDDLAADSVTLRLRVVVEPSVSAYREPSPAQWRAPDADHLIVWAPGVLAAFDVARGTGVIYVEEFRVHARASFRDSVIRGPALMLPTRHDRHPIHAAAIRKGDAALILHGPSGAGKSTLGYAASRAGLEVLTDDAIRVQRATEFRVWGSPGHVNLLDDARNRFAELRARQFTPVQSNRGLKHVVDVPRPASNFVRRVRVCVLDSNRGTVQCTPIGMDEIVETIVAAPEARADAYEAGRRPAAAAIAARGGWRLRLSDDPCEAVPHLQRMLDEI